MLPVSFSFPWMLPLVVVPAVLAIWVWRCATATVTVPVDHSSYPFRRLWGWLVNSARTLPALLAAIVVVILAGPQTTGTPKSERILTNIEFCVDVSGSMTASFGAGTRYDASMEAINQFLDYREGDAFGLTFFGVEVLHWVPLTQDVSAFRCAPPFMNPSNPGHPPWLGGTMIGNALLECRKVLKSRDEGDRMIVLISDGYSADLSGDAPDKVAKQLAADRIVVYGIHIGGGAVPDPIVKIAARTDGEVFAVGEQSALEAVFRRIDTMQETRLRKTAAETHDHFRPFALAGLSVAGLYLLTLFGLRYAPW